VSGPSASTAGFSALLSGQRRRTYCSHQQRAPCSPMVGPHSPGRSHRGRTLLTYGGTPQPRTQPQRTNPYHRSRDGQDTHVDGHGRTEGAVLAVQSRWSRTPTLDGGGRAFLGDKQLLLGHPPQAAPDCGVPSRRPPRRLCNPHGTNPPNREAMPAIERTRPGHPSQTHRPEASGQTKRWR